MANYSLALHRQIIQLRFRPTLQWFSLRSNMAFDLESKYEEWRSDNNGNIALYSPEKREALEVYTGHITHIRENNETDESNIEHLSFLSTKFSEECQVEDLKRLGLRHVSVYKSEFAFQDIIDIIESKLFQREENHPQKGQVVDLAYVFDTLNNNIKTHVQIGAVKAEEGIKRFDAKFDKKNIILKTENNLFIDIDLSIETGIKPEEIQTKLRLLNSEANSTLEEYLNLLGNK